MTRAYDAAICPYIPTPLPFTTERVSEAELLADIERAEAAACAAKSDADKATGAAAVAKTEMQAARHSMQKRESCSP